MTSPKTYSPWGNKLLRSVPLEGICLLGCLGFNTGLVWPPNRQNMPPWLLQRPIPPGGISSFGICLLGCLGFNIGLV